MVLQALYQRNCTHTSGKYNLNFQNLKIGAFCALEIVTLLELIFKC